METPKPGPIPQFPAFSAEPTTREIARARIFEEPLVPWWGEPNPEETKALADALTTFAKRTRPDDFSALEGFVESPLSLNWYPSVLFCLGWEYLHTGYFSKAMGAWEEAWLWLQDDPQTKILADRAVGEWAKLHARVGGAERLEEILDEIKGRQLLGPGAELVSGARQALWLMKNKPEISFRCGPLALRSVCQVLRPGGDVNQLIAESYSSEKGFSLPQLIKLSQDLRLNFQMAKREPGSPLLVPCVVHWKVGHYAAIIQNQGNRYLVIDPTFGRSRWVSLQAIDAEGSGYIAVPPGRLPAGWQSVGPVEAQSVWGRGVTGSSDPNHTTPYDLKSDPDCVSRGMAVPSVHLMLVSLNIEDTPIAFRPPRGPPVSFSVTYNQREANQPTQFGYSNFGQKWTCNWISYLKDSGTNESADVEHYVAGGGTELFIYDASNQVYEVQWRSQAKLVRQSASSYELTFPDGSRHIFSQPDGTVGNTRKVFLTHIIDPTGYTNLLNYDPNLRLATVTDPAAQVTNLTLFYNAAPTAGSTDTIQKVTDRFGRSAHFGYKNLLTQLESIADPISLTSKVSYAFNSIKKLETPYGTTTFDCGDDEVSGWIRNNPNATRQQFENYLRQRYSQPDLKNSFPNGL